MDLLRVEYEISYSNQYIANSDVNWHFFSFYRLMIAFYFFREGLCSLPPGDKSLNNNSSSVHDKVS